MSDENKYFWYAIRVVSGCEKKIIDLIYQNADKAGLSGQIERIVVPVEKKLSSPKSGKRVEIEVPICSGYILANIILSDELIETIRRVQGVLCFMGDDGKPVVIPDNEIDKMQFAMGGSFEHIGDIGYTIGEHIYIKDGMFEGLNGVIEDVIEGEKKLKVGVSIFGKFTPVELYIYQVEKINIE